MDRIKVLLVDDHPMVREGLRAMLSTASDIEVVGEAGDGLEAVEKAIELQPRIVLMDLSMPNLNGLEATRRFKNQLPATSVIVLTVYDNDAYVVDAIRAGAGGYLLKDASRDFLVHAIRAVNEGGMLIKSDLLREAMLSLAHGPGAHPKERSPTWSELDELTPREREVLGLVAQGRSNKEIGQALSISEDTAKKHVGSIMSKLGASDRTQAAVKAVRAGLFSGLLD